MKFDITCTTAATNRMMQNDCKRKLQSGILDCWLGFKFIIYLVQELYVRLKKIKNLLHLREKAPFIFLLGTAPG